MSHYSSAFLVHFWKSILKKTIFFRLKFEFFIKSKQKLIKNSQWNLSRNRSRFPTLINRLLSRKGISGMEGILIISFALLVSITEMSILLSILLYFQSSKFHCVLKCFHQERVLFRLHFAYLLTYFLMFCLLLCQILYFPMLFYGFFTSLCIHQ